MAAKRGKSRKWLLLVVGIVALPVLLISAVPLVFMAVNAYEAAKWERLMEQAMSNAQPQSALLTIPGSSISVENSRIASHPFLAEYDRYVTYIKDEERSEPQPLYVDVGGGYPINCYLLEDNGKLFIRMKDAVSEHLLDLQNQVTYTIHAHEGSSFLLDPTDNEPLVPLFLDFMDPMMSPPIGEESGWNIEPRGIPMEQILQHTDEVYLGRFDTQSGTFRFIPASEAPEVRIRKLFE